MLWGISLKLSTYKGRKFAVEDIKKVKGISSIFRPLKNV